MKVLTVLRLELWKQKKAFFATLFVLALGIGAPAILLPFIRAVQAMDSFRGAAAFLVFLLPFAIVFLGASAASALRNTEEKMLEELLPVHPLIRVYGAYIVSLVLSTCISLLVLSLLGNQNVFYLVSIRFGMFQIPIETILFYTVSLHCLAFALTYLLHLPVLGAGVALALSAIDFFFRGVLYLEKRLFLYNFGNQQFPEPLNFLVCLPFLLILLSPAFAALRIERFQSIGRFRVLTLIIFFLAGPVWTIAMVSNVVHALETQMGGTFSFWNSFWDVFAGNLP